MLAVGLALPTAVNAKKPKVTNVYMFGLAASFNDSIVYFTDVQEIQEATINGKTKFLQAREQYARQLRDYLKNSQSESQRTCIVFYDKKRKKVEKKFLKMKRLYTQSKKKKDARQQYDVRFLDAGAFRFQVPAVAQEASNEQ